MQTKGQNFYFWSGFRFQKWFNMSYEHMLKVRVLSNIDDLKKKFFVSMLKVSLQREGKPETKWKPVYWWQKTRLLQTKFPSRHVKLLPHTHQKKIKFVLSLEFVLTVEYTKRNHVFYVFWHFLQVFFLIFFLSVAFCCFMLYIRLMYNWCKLLRFSVTLFYSFACMIRKYLS